MSDDNKEGAGVPVAYVVRDAEGGSLHDFTDYYNADQFWIRNRSRMLKPQFLFCYDAPAAVMPAAPSDADARLLHAFGRRTAFEIGDHALPLMLGPNWNHQGCYGENSEWLCLRFNSIEERDEFRAAARAWENVARERADAACQACGDSGVVTDTEGHKWPCYQRCAALSQTMQPQPEPAAGGQAGAVAVRAWINYPVKVVNGEFAGYGEPELSFKRLSYGYDCDKAEALYLAAPDTAIAAREQEWPGEVTDAQIDDWIITLAVYDIAGPKLLGRDRIHRFARAVLALKGIQPGERKEGV